MHIILVYILTEYYFSLMICEEMKKFNNPEQNNPDKIST